MTSVEKDCSLRSSSKSRKSVTLVKRQNPTSTPSGSIVSIGILTIAHLLIYFYFKMLGRHLMRREVLFVELGLGFGSMHQGSPSRALNTQSANQSSCFSGLYVGGGLIQIDGRHSLTGAAGSRHPAELGT